MPTPQGVIISNSGERKFLNLITADRTNWRVRLYTNSRIINGEEVVADFDEATFEGYEAQTPPEFEAADTLDEGEFEGRAQAVCSEELVFTQTVAEVPQTIYGYFVTHETHNIVLFAESFVDEDANADPQTLDAAGESITITLRLQLTTEGG